MFYFTTVLLCLCLLQTCAVSSEKTNEILAKELHFEKQENDVKVAYFNAKKFTGKAVSHYGNGHLFTEKNYVKGLESGDWKIWYSNGKPMKSGHIKDGKNEGVFYEWYENGQKKYEQPYLANKKHGKWLSWYETGEKWTARDFVNDELHGKILIWHTDGTLTKEYTYKNGVLVDKQFYFEEEK